MHHFIRSRYAVALLAAVAIALTCVVFDWIAVPPVDESGLTRPLVFVHVILALGAVIILGRILAKVFAKAHQPSVIGEVVAGIVLGPSLLGRLFPDAFDFLVPSAIVPIIGVIAQVGVVLYMFLVGLEMNTDRVGAMARSVIAVAIAGLIVPFAAGSALAVWLYPQVSGATVPQLRFVLFVGIAIAITAFPVLARILKDRGLEDTPVGVTALGAAAIGDVVAWCLLAVVVGIAKEQWLESLRIVGLACVFVAVMLLVVRPVVRKWVGTRSGVLTIAAVTLGMAVAAATTSAIGLHALFGAFLFGALIPHDTRVAQKIPPFLSPPVTRLLLPAFFAFTGLRTQIGLLSSATDWALCGAITFIAFASKVGATSLAARLTGHDRPSALAIGWLMTTKGLMELIVLNLGLELGIISPRLFTMMVLMALATTISASPAVTLLLRVRMPDHQGNRIA